MVNPMAGEVEVLLDGQPVMAKLTLGALAALEAELEGNVLDLIGRFEAGQFSSRDVLAVVVAGLRGAGWQGRAENLLTVEIGGGAAGATRAAVTLLARAFRGA